MALSSAPTGSRTAEGSSDALRRLLHRRSGARLRARPAHARPSSLAFLATHRDRICAAGPLREVADGTPDGALWIVEAESPEAVTALYEADPFCPTGLRRSIRILLWSQVFAD